jgi:non-heme chloroperoxidase
MSLARLISFLLLLAWTGQPARAQAAPTAQEWVDRSPHTSGFATASGIRLHYLDWGGTGEPLLLLAGLFGSAHGFEHSCGTRDEKEGLS